MEISNYVPTGPFTPLQVKNTEIRLLVIKSGIPDHPLHCELSIWTLESAAEHGYETISYCWGDKADTAFIWVNGFNFYVPRSASEALHRFRLQDEDRSIWLDCVCINQSDDAEKTHQVAMMDKIYMEGRHNLIWLGEDDGTVHQALEEMKLYYEEARRLTNDFDEQEWGSSELYERTSAYSNTKAFRRLCSRPWWRRSWIIQEAALAPTSTCHCGRYSFSLTFALRAIQWAASTDALRIDGVPQTLLHFVDRQLGVIWKHPERSSEGDDLHWMIEATAPYGVSDPRDRVYGMLGIYCHISELQKIPELLYPDYGKPMTKTFQDATRYIIQTSGSLDVLLYVCHASESDSDNNFDYPRWVRRWDIEYTQCPLQALPWLTAAPGTKVRREDIELDFGSASNILKLEGILLDHVKTVSEVCRRSNVLSFLNEVLEMSNQSLRTCEEDAKTITLLETLVAGTLNNKSAHEAAPRELLSSFTTYFARLNQCLDDPSSLETLEEESLELRRFAYSIRVACRERRFFQTASGHVGLGPQTMKIGDTSAVLYGCSYPLILRPLDPPGHYKFVGACYVSGIMQGEAFREHQSHGREDNVFFVH